MPYFTKQETVEQQVFLSRLVLHEISFQFLNGRRVVYYKVLDF